MTTTPPEGQASVEDVIADLRVTHPWAISGEWRVEVSDRRTRMAVTVDDYGIATLVVPQDVNPSMVARFVRSSCTSVARQRNRLAPYTPDHPTKELVPGENFPLFGTPHRLQLTGDGPDVRLDETRHQGWLSLRRDQTSEAIVGWYGVKLLGWVTRPDTERCGPYWAGRLGLAEPINYKVADLGPRKWSKFTVPNTVALHWALAQLDRSVIGYVLAHALVHASRPGGSKHGPEFRRRMARLFCGPDEWELEERLRKDGRSVWLGGTKS